MSRMSEVDRQLAEAQAIGASLHDPRFQYSGATTHATSDAFKRRQIERGLRPTDEQKDQRERDERCLRALQECLDYGTPTFTVDLLAAELRLSEKWENR